MEKLLAMAMICASGSAGDNFYRLSPDDGVEAARASIVLFAVPPARWESSDVRGYIRPPLFCNRYALNVACLGRSKTTMAAGWKKKGRPHINCLMEKKLEDDDSITAKSFHTTILN